MDLQARNNLIRENGKQTRLKRKSQICKTFKFKVDKSNLTSQQREAIKMMFVEAKWLYNYLLAKGDVYNIDYKTLNVITHKDKHGNDVTVNIQYVGSSVKQEIMAQIATQIKGLSVLKQHGHTVGKLKFKSEVNSVRLKQYGITHSLKGRNKIKIQGIKGHIRLLGTKQLSKYENIDYTTANLIYDGYDWFVCLTCYVDRTERKLCPTKCVGIDMGISTTVTTSDGDKIDCMVEESERLKRLQRKLSRQTRRSNNWYKTKSLIRKEYIHICNKRKDVANKIVNMLDSNYDVIVIQDEQIAAWKDNRSDSGRYKMHHSCLGTLKTKLMSKDNVVVLDKWCPTTKYCSKCGNMTTLNQTERIYVCPVCNTKEDRDIHAANNMIYFYLTFVSKYICSSSGTGGWLNLPVKKISWKNLKTMLSDQENITSLV